MGVVPRPPNSKGLEGEGVVLEAPSNGFNPEMVRSEVALSIPDSLSWAQVRRRDRERERQETLVANNKLNRNQVAI